MKTRNKALLLTLCALMLVAASVLGTMAYLTSQDAVTNTFTVGNVKITLDEKDVDNDTNTNDNVTQSDGSVRDKANSYKLMPGKEYEKDPTVHVTKGSESCYVFVEVVNEISGIEAASEVAADGYKTIADQMAANNWKPVAGYTGVYVYATGTDTKTAVTPTATADTDLVVFKKFAVKESATNDSLAAYSGETITVTAYAVQKDGFESSTAAEIWTTAGFATT